MRTSARRPGRVVAATASLLLIASACAPNDQGSAPSPDAADEGADVASSAPDGGDDGSASPDAADSGSADAEASGSDVDTSEWEVAASATWSGAAPLEDGSVDLRLAVEPGVGEPFGRLASCSGLRRYVGAYSMFVSDGAGLAMSVWTSDRVAAAGIYDAEVRVERDGAVVVGSGTVTIDGDLQRGEVLAFPPDGGRIELAFECSGPASPTPIDVAAGEGDAEQPALEVFAVMRRGDAERVVGLAAIVGDRVRCPASGGTGDLVISVDGDEGLGAITAMELVGGARPRLAVTVGAATFEAGDVELDLADDATSGTFAAVTPDGTSIDGAFRCSRPLS